MFKKIKTGLILFVGVIFLFWLITIPISKGIKQNYQEKIKKQKITDRKGKVIFQGLKDDVYFLETKKIPKNVKNKLLGQEDQLFYYHLGVNPWSVIRASFKSFKGGVVANSTITQQLIKNVKEEHIKRSFSNKIKETFLATALEFHTSKKEILEMYTNVVYMGHQVQGLETASQFYFSKTLNMLEKKEITELIETIPCPSYCNPFKNKKKSINQKPKSKTNFEANDLCKEKEGSCQITIDSRLNEQLRKILKEEIEKLKTKKVSHGAVVVLDNTGEIIALVGSPDPLDTESGRQINMALKPRSIGSTIKPILFSLAFEKGLRPYTLVSDREYKYQTGVGFDFFPKNYDQIYHGTVKLSYSLANSLNVPTVKVLEFLGMEKVMEFFEDSKITPVQSLDEYQLSVALGGLELSPIELAKLFLPFLNEGQGIVASESVQLTNQILTDNSLRVDQFGAESPLQLKTKQKVAVKTGTSREYHDSWTVGYTPDFIIVVWLGNTDETPMEKISGSQGAGRVWNRSINLLLNNEYNKRTPFDFSKTKWFEEVGDYGLKNDIPNEYKNLLENTPLILSPHHNDTYKLEPNISFFLTATENSEWFINNEFLGTGKRVNWQPIESGSYNIEAQSVGNKESESINVMIEK